MKDLALITIHGMGQQEEDYARDFEKDISNWLDSKWKRISFQSIHYAPILQDPQDELWEAIVEAQPRDIDMTRLRQFFLYGFGDAGSLEFSARQKNPADYVAVQEEIQRALTAAFEELGEDSKKPVVIVAQSLGCQVISNYIWDAVHGTYIFKGKGSSKSKKQEFLRLISLRHLFTTGCNIPLFVAGLGTRRFKKPNTKFRWHNYFDPDDVLGWPLAQLGADYHFVEDHPINAGGIFTSWNPLSHTNYWADRDFLRPLATALDNLIE